MRYLRLWRQFVITAFVREAEYRFNFVVVVAEGTAQLVLAVLTTLLIYRFTPEIQGWTRADLLMLVGIYRVVDSLIALQIAPNMHEITRQIRSGEMDFLLLRPVSSQFLVSLRELRLPEAVNATIGLGLAIYAGYVLDGRNAMRLSLLGVAEAGISLVCGLIALYAIWFMIVTLGFWLVQVPTLDTLFYSAFETARYPVTFFKGFVRTLLTWAFPVAFATTFPTRALAGETDAATILYAVGLAGFFLTASHLFWRYATRHYSSASS
jgi:ABC-2 type transport system permease protein